MLFLGAIPLSYFIYFEEWSNFHTVTQGKFYRSAEMDNDELVYYLKTYKIKSLVNLEGKSEKTWYRDEIDVCKELNINHYNFRMSAVHMVNNDTTDKLINLLKNIPKPILVHCYGGADRSGYVSAIWQYAIEKKDYKTASRQLSWFYFHLPYFGTKTIAMDKSLKNYVNYTKRKLL